MSPNLAGAVLMMASMACFTFNDAATKSIGTQMPLFQMLFLRGVLSTILILFLARTLGTVHFRIRRDDWLLIALRCVAEVVTAYFFLNALFNMQLANLTAILQALPLTVTLGTALFFGEKVGWRRMLAIVVGFSGVLLIVRPGTDGFNVYALYGLAAVMCVTVRDLATKKLSKDVPSMTVTLCAILSVMVFSGFASLATPWVPVTPQFAGLIALAALFILGGYYFSVATMRTGDVSFIAPFRYTGLIWSLLLGWLIFGDWPDGLTMLGAGIVVAMGLFTLYRERALLKG
ncbi:DMT family transporter [Ascidiaceihabitans sp.]|uniref:DMT family transporter n=1 Tax=Ascidiaceihabitans sp. TaxID=1872644 RepID=UPI00329A4D0F